MGIAEAASGPTDNAGKAKTGGLDDAISAAFEASESEDLSSLLKDEPKGKAAAKVEAEPDENAGDDTPSEDAAKAPVEAEESEEPQVLSAPKHWPDADKQAFAKLTKEGQEIILRKSKDLEGGFTRKSQELSDKAKYADNVRGLIGDQRRAFLQSQGIDEMAYLKRLNDIHAMADRDPVGYLKWAMQSMGVKPEQLGISQAQTPQTPPNAQATTDEQLVQLLADPEVARLRSDLQNLQGKIEKEERSKQEAENARRVNAVNALSTTIATFRQSLDETGQLQYPHFDSVKGHMGALMDTDPDLNQLPDGPEKLQKAYDMAVWARPDLRQAMIKTEAQKEIQSAQKKRDAERAKKVTGVKPAAGVVSTKPKTNSLDDALSQAMSKAGL